MSWIPHGQPLVKAVKVAAAHDAVEERIRLAKAASAMLSYLEYRKETFNDPEAARLVQMAKGSE